MPVSFYVAADAYDRFMDAWSRLLAPQLADLADVRAGQRVLGVGCGSGSLTAELVTRVGRDRVVAVDPSEPFVAAAIERHPGGGRAARPDSSAGVSLDPGTDGDRAATDAVSAGS